MVQQLAIIIIMALQIHVSVDIDEGVLKYNRSLEHQIAILQREVSSLKRKVVLFEDENNRNRWGIRYSRRMAIMSNLVCGNAVDNESSSNRE